MPDSQVPDPSDSVVRSAFEGASVGMALTDLQGVIQKCNPAFADLLGTSPAAVIGRRFAEFTHPDDVGHNLELFDDLVSGRRAFYTLEKRYLHARGGHVWARVTTSVVRSRSGSLEYVLGTAQDISAERRAMERMEAMERELAQARKLEAIGRFAGGVAHDFGNLVGVVQGYGEELAERLGEDHPLQHEVGVLLAATTRATRLIDALLAFSRPDPVQAEPVDVNEVISGMVPVLRRLPGEGITLAVDLASGLPLASADPTQLERVVLNLVSNARRAMPDGGVVTICTGRGEGSDGHPRVRLAVIDQGVGMDEATRDRVFEPFFTTARKTGGTGMGLATVYGIVRACGGSIDVQSRLGAGSTFSVLLPPA